MNANASKISVKPQVVALYAKVDSLLTCKTKPFSRTLLSPTVSKLQAARIRLLVVTAPTVKRAVVEDADLFLVPGPLTLDEEDNR
jgi:hypothetical protein